MAKVQAGVQYKIERLTILGRYSFLVSCQFVLCFMLSKEMIDQPILFACYPEKNSIVLARFICGTVLHFNLQPELA